MKIYLLYFLALLVCSFHVSAKPYQHDSNNVALSGYDVVSYFNIDTSSNPSKGFSQYSYTWSDINWYFSSEQNLNNFKDHPENYVPQYLGYCAHKVSENYIYKGDPLVWSIYDGKLYLYANVTAKSTWQGDIIVNINKGNSNWAKLRR